MFVWERTQLYWRFSSSFFPNTFVVYITAMFVVVVWWYFSAMFLPLFGHLSFSSPSSLSLFLFLAKNQTILRFLSMISLSLPECRLRCCRSERKTIFADSSKYCVRKNTWTSSTPRNGQSRRSKRTKWHDRNLQLLVEVARESERSEMIKRKRKKNFCNLILLVVKTKSSWWNWLNDW